MSPSAPWPRLGEVPPGRLLDARLQAHHAAQLVVALGISYLDARPDDSHTNLEWLPGGALAGRTLPSDPPCRGALVLDPLELQLLGEAGDVLDEYPLAGRTRAQAVRWLGEALRTAGLDPARLSERRHYTIPAHPVAGDGEFRPDPASAGELARWYRVAAAALAELQAARSDASEVRCWPHHFDIATLLTMAPGKTVGAGLSPGDEHYAQPYFYVTPYPYPDTGKLGALPAGHWHTSGWVGAVLTGEELVRLPGEARAETASRFLQGSTATCEALL